MALPRAEDSTLDYYDLPAHATPYHSVSPQSSIGHLLACHSIIFSTEVHGLPPNVTKLLTGVRAFMTFRQQHAV